MKTKLKASKAVSIASQNYLSEPFTEDEAKEMLPIDKINHIEDYKFDCINATGGEVLDMILDLADLLMDIAEKYE